MRNVYTQNKSKQKVIRKVSLVLGLLLLTTALPAQNIIDTLNWSTDGYVKTVAIFGKYLYFGGDFNYVGKETGSAVFFKKDAVTPEKNSPFFADDLYNSRIRTAVPDGNGGWYIGGNNLFYDGAGKLPNYFIHLLKDKTIDPNWNFNFYTEYGLFINSLKRDGNYLYVGGQFTVTDDRGKKHYNIIRINTVTRKIDPDWNLPFFSAYKGTVENIVLTQDKVFLTTTGLNWENIDGKWRGDLVVVDKNKGNWIPFPSTCGPIYAMGDTLLFTSPMAYHTNGLLLLQSNKDHTLNAYPYGQLKAAVSDGKGGWFVAGNYGNNNGIFHLNSKLQQTGSFVQQDIGNVNQLLLLGNALFVSANQTLTVNGKEIKYLFKLDTVSGTIDTAFAPNPSDLADALNGKGDTLIVGGRFSTIAGVSQHLAAFTTDGKLLSWNPQLNFDWSSSLKSLKFRHDTLYVAGQFSISYKDNAGNDKSIYSLARFNMRTGSLDTSFHVQTTNVSVPQFTGMAFANNRLYVAGYFNNWHQLQHLAYINLTDGTVKNIPRLQLTTSWLNPDLKVYNHNDTLYITGGDALDSLSGTTRTGLFSLDATTNQVTAWKPNPQGLLTFSISGNNILLSVYGQDYHSSAFYCNFQGNQQWGGLDLQTMQYIRLPEMQHYNSKLAITKKYIFVYSKNGLSACGDSTVNGIARIKRKDLSVTSFHPKFTYLTNYTNTMYNITPDSSGLYVAGPFTVTDKQGAVRRGLCLLDPETGERKDWYPPNSNGEVKTVFTNENEVLVAGGFSMMPAWKRNSVARIDLSANELSDWAPEVKSAQFANIEVRKIFPGSDTIYLFSNNSQMKVSGNDAGNLCAVDAIDGQLISGFKPVFAPYYDSYCPQNCIQQGNYFYFTGDFKQLNNNPQYAYVAKISTSTGEIQEMKTPPVTGGTVYTFLSDKDTAYIGGYNLTLNNDYQKLYGLIKYDLKTGKVYKTYPLNNYSVTSLEQSGQNIVATLGWQGLFNVLPDTLLRLKNQARYTQWFETKTTNGLFLNTGGQIYEYGGKTLKTGFSVYDLRDDTVLYAFGMPEPNSFSTGMDPTTFAFNDEVLVIGGNFRGAFGRRNRNLVFLKAPRLSLQPDVASWSPKKANNVDPFAIHVYGLGFNQNSTVVLQNSDKTVRADSTFVKSHEIIAWFNGENFTVGNWNLQVNINDTITKQYENAINIVKGSKASLWSKLTGPSMVLVHKPETYYLTIGNDGDADAYGAMLYIGVGKGQTVNFLHDEIDSPDIPYKHINIDYDTAKNYVDVDYFFGKPMPGGKVYTLFIPYLPAGYEHTFRITVTSDVHGEEGNVYATISQPLFSNYSEVLSDLKSSENINGLWGSFFDCAYNVASTAVELTPLGGCVKSVIDNLIIEGVKTYVNDQKVTKFQLIKSGGSIIVDCSGAGEINKAIQIAKEVVQQSNTNVGIYQSCKSFVHNLFSFFTYNQTYYSVDPNAKYGPAGLGSSAYTRSDVPYNYMVMFENDSAATAPAERVIITDTLNQNVFDLNTFKPVAFSFGDTTYRYRETDGDTVDIDLRPQKNTIVRVIHHLDKNSGVLTWYFLSLDPDTYEITSNPANGFLPPNRTSPEGEGSILYSINPFAGLDDGAVINNSAHIVFDWNESIPTDTWHNVTDNTAPESTVNSLPAVEVDKDFSVSWKGSDDGSGIYSYTVFVSENDSAYYPWLVDTRDTSAVFSGEPGVTYKFYTVATDSAGNQEPAPAGYDAMTQVSGTGIETFGQGSKVQFRIYPNPVSDQLFIKYYLPESSDVSVDVLNVCGYPVTNPVKQSQLHGTGNVSLDVSKLAAGYYFVRIRTKHGIQIRKVIVR